MGKTSSSASDVEVTVQPRHGNGTIHPLEMGSVQSIWPPPETAMGSLSGEVKPFRRWRSCLVPAIVMANVFLFVITMFVNNCPRNSSSCVVSFLGRFSFQPVKENPLLGPSSNTFAKSESLGLMSSFAKSEKKAYSREETSGSSGSPGVEEKAYSRDGLWRSSGVSKET